MLMPLLTSTAPSCIIILIGLVGDLKGADKDGITVGGRGMLYKLVA